MNNILDIRMLNTEVNKEYQYMLCRIPARMKIFN